jgi:PadR family transcriptional regulator, regulatory protein PadR
MVSARWSGTTAWRIASPNQLTSGTADRVPWVCHPAGHRIRGSADRFASRPYVVRLHSTAVDDLELTPKMAALIKIFLEDPQQPRYGFELMRLTRQPSGSVYPMLARFVKAGWLTAGKEDIDPRAEGRPPRRNYRITAAAVASARIQLAALSEQYRPPVPVRTRLAPGGTS